MSDLSILCVTKMEAHTMPFLIEMSEIARVLDAELVIAADGSEAVDRLLAANERLGAMALCEVKSNGDIGSVLDTALKVCRGPFVLRLDDDERCSLAMASWLATYAYRISDHWKFPRANLWGDERHYLRTPQLWPDHQTRLSVKHKAGDRKAVHAGSPYGGGTLAPCVIEHHKFLVRSLEARREIVRRYDSIQAGAGTNFRAFSCPEDFYSAEELANSVATWDGDKVMEEARP